MITHPTRKSSSKRIGKLLLFALFVYSNLIVAQSIPVAESEIDGFFTQYNDQTPGVSVAVLRNGELAFSKGYGMANLEHDIPITSKTIFHVASVSKQFTAFAIYLLAERGSLSLDDDIRKYLSEIPDFGSAIRIKHLLAHTSGLRDQWALLTLAGWRMDDVITTKQILKLVSQQRQLNFKPGTQFLYCNTGYTLLAEIIGRVTGKSFADYTREAIFLPLGMNNSQFYDDYQQLVKGRADSYEKQNGQYITKKLNYATVGATSLMTTAEDLAKWVRNFEQPIVGNPKLIAEFDKISSLENGQAVIWSAQPNDTTYHAKGQLHYYHKGVKAISHGGHDAGFRATLTRFPEQHLAVIALSNDEHYNAFGTLMGIAESYLKEIFQEDEAAPRPASTPQKADMLPDTDLSVYAGSYRSEELSMEYRLVEDQGKLKMLSTRLSDIELTQTGTNLFSGLNSFPIELSFIRVSGTVTGFTISNFGVKDLHFHRIEGTLSEPIAEVPIIDRQLAAYNSRDLEAFLATYDDQIEIYNAAGDLMGQGKAFMSATYGGLFRDSPTLHCKIQKRIVLGNTVIDHEQVSGFNGTTQVVEAIAVYQVKDGKIRRVYFFGRE